MSKKKLPDPLTPDERAALLRVPNRRYLSGLRNLVMMRIMLDAGLRCAEVLALRVAHVDLNTGKLFVREGKGKKDRALWLNPDTIELLREWRERREHQSELYFTTRDGGPINSRYLRAMMERYSERAGLNRHCSPHTLRHTFATDIYKQTRNLELVRRMLGHRFLSTTAIYLHVADPEVEEAMKSFRV